MADLVERLLALEPKESNEVSEVMLAAADEIERLQKVMAASADEIEQLRYELDMRVGVEIELAQLHARIEAAPSARIELDKMGVFPEIVDYYDGDVMPLATQGKRVRLVVCDE